MDERERGRERECSLFPLAPSDKKQMVQKDCFPKPEEGLRQTCPGQGLNKEALSHSKTVLHVPCSLPAAPSMSLSNSIGWKALCL